METEQKLSEVLSEFARTLVTDFPIQGILDHLVGRIVEILPISAAGVTLISPGTAPRYVAASDDSALAYERLQTELGEGPCVLAYETGEAVSVPDLGTDVRFPNFTPRALEEGLRGVFTFPLRHGDRQLGALDLYRHVDGALGDRVMAVAQTLADVAATYLLNAQARAELEESSQLASHRSLHDPLTGLPNRILLVQRLEHAILRSQRSKKMVAVLFVDLDRFKAVNDTYGHHVGDELLTVVAQRLGALLRPGDTLARMAGDEFVILCEDLDTAASAETVAVRVGTAFAEAFVLSGTAVVVTASVGIAFAGLGADVPEHVLQEADLAMYQAKRRGTGRYGVVDRREQRLANHRTALNRDLRHALDRRELGLAYQPIVATADQRIVGVEALLRWTHPTFGMIAPTVAVPLAEQAGLITEIGRWVLEQACSDRRLLSDQSPNQELEMSVNVSAYQLMAPDFAATVGLVLEQTDTDPAHVVLELTESVFIQDAERALSVLKDLKRLGVRLALDDFGTGFSSLSYLDQFPVDVVKVDRAFISDLDREPSRRVIVGSIVELAHGLGLTVVAEGIETAQQFQVVATLACDSCQGFYFARPLLVGNRLQVAIG
jgi:diguanylate cyclase (GGDEF)-like protein